MKHFDELKSTIEKLEWLCTLKNDFVTIEKRILGRHFVIEGQPKDGRELLECVADTSDNFDPSGAAYFWIDEEGHGITSMPYEMGDVYNIMLKIKKELDDLTNLLQEEVCNIYRREQGEKHHEKII